jgi:hypothetical protein
MQCPNTKALPAWEGPFHLPVRKTWHILVGIILLGLLLPDLLLRS